MSPMRGVWVLLLVLVAGCGAVPPVPDFTYYRLPPAQALERFHTRLFSAAIEVDPFSADGLYADQALVYSLDADGQQVRQYHYQLWTDPPTYFLQRRLIGQLRDANLAPLVTDELPASKAVVRIGGLIVRFDRVPLDAGGFGVVVALKLRVDGADGSVLIDHIYRAQAPAAGPEIGATVDAYAVALDTIVNAFLVDLKKQAVKTHAG